MSRSATSSRRSWTISGRRFAASESDSASDRARAGVLAAAVALALGLTLLALLPTPAYAWTPGTHVFLGQAVLQSLAALPGVIAELLHAFPYDFLYGSIAADTSMAKKYAPAGRHCHSWTVGREIFESAEEGRMRAFGLGYLAHLAADSVAHNYFVPRQLAVTSSTASLGHSYWESRFETHLGELWPRRARELILLDHSVADEHLDRILSPTIFSTRTNRRIFRGMVYVADSESWQRIFQVVSENSRWDLPEPHVVRYVDRSYDFIMDLLVRMDESEPYHLDPSGEEPLRLAKRVRREALRSGGDKALRDAAQRHFGLPSSSLRYSTTLPEPLYVPTRSASS